MEGLEADYVRSRGLGFQGRVTVYPPQVDPVQRGYSALSDEDAARNRRIVEAFEEAEAQGVASLRVDGLFVDYPDLPPRARPHPPVRRLAGDHHGGHRMNPTAELPLEGIQVVDSASLFAGPVDRHDARRLRRRRDQGRAPAGDNLRKLGWEKDGVSLWWAIDRRATSAP